MSPPYSASKNKSTKETSMKQVVKSLCYLLHAGFLLAVLFDPEDVGEVFLRSVG
jgi:hypothetical protein